MMTSHNSASLFDDGADRDFNLVAVLAHGKPNSRAQQAFQRLVTRIELKRQQLRQWQDYALLYNRRVAGELEPLRTRLCSIQRQMAALIDQLLSEPKPARRLGHMQRAKLWHLLANLLNALPHDEALATLRDKYHDDSSEQIDLLEHARRQMRARAARQAQRAQKRRRERTSQGSKSNTAMDDLARADQAQAAREVGQALRDVYRKLVSALHPDREPDDDARQRKTLLMQRVNLAYDANDLLTLLGLQLQIEQIDAAHLSSVPPQRLAQYNQILHEQLAGLESELEIAMQPFREMGFGSGGPLSVPAVDQRLSAEIAQTRSAVRELSEDLVAFRDPNKLRAALERFEFEEVADDPDDLAALYDLLQTEVRPARGRSSHSRRSRR